MTAVYNYVTDTGTIVDDSSSLLTDVQGEYRTALGANINVNAATPQGTMIAGEAIARTNVMKNNADLANVFNPNLSYGVFLDGICALLGVTRGKNTYTTATGVLLSGGSNPVTVAAGSEVTTENGDIFQILAPVAIPANGTAMATIESVVFGPVALPVGPLTITSGTIGWGGASITAQTIVTPGTIALTDPQLKTARNQELYSQGNGSSGAIQAAILKVPGVTSALVIENNTGQFAMPVNGVTFTLPNAMWVCVSGTPNESQLAQAMYNAHNGGCPWDFGATGMGTPVNSPNGTLATDPITGVQYYTKRVTPLMYDTYVNITVHQQTSVATPTESVQNAILAYAEGMLTGEPGLVIGGDVSAFEISGAVIQQLPGMYVKSCMIACVPAGSPPPTYPSGYSYEWVAGAFEQAQLAVGNVMVNLV